MPGVVVFTNTVPSKDGVDGFSMYVIMNISMPERVLIVSIIIYNKLVRDRIPEIIDNSGKQCICTTLPEDKYIAMLDAKLNEELAEYQESKSMEELADLLEVIRAVAIARGSSIEEVEAIRRDKAAKRGGFEKKLLLTEVITKD